jgi:hypothetical protein
MDESSDVADVAWKAVISVSRPCVVRFCVAASNAHRTTRVGTRQYTSPGTEGRSVVVVMRKTFAHSLVLVGCTDAPIWRGGEAQTTSANAVRPDGCSEAVADGATRGDWLQGLRAAAADAPVAQPREFWVGFGFKFEFEFEFEFEFGRVVKRYL